MHELLRELETRWKQVSQYDDIRAVRWTPADAVAESCPAGCALVDTGWQSMAADTFGMDAYRRTTFCREHGFARIYVISGTDAADAGWQPSGGQDD